MVGPVVSAIVEITRALSESRRLDWPEQSCVSCCDGRKVKCSVGSRASMETGAYTFMPLVPNGRFATVGISRE